MNKQKIGFIGQGFIGGNMANEFEARGYDVVRYSKNKFPHNLEALQKCDIVFVGVPTPTKNKKFDGSVLEDAIKATAPGQKIVIKSTVYPGTTDKLQEQYPDRYFFHSAEFLAERSAAHDVANPTRTVLGLSIKCNVDHAQEIFDVLPQTEIKIFCTARQSELGKYFSNFLLTTKIIMANLMYDVCEGMSEDYEVVKNIAATDPRIGDSHLDCVFEGGRGANGHCFPKDLATFAQFYNELPIYTHYDGQRLLGELQDYNLAINIKSGKQPEILQEVYGEYFTFMKNSLEGQDQQPGQPQ